MLYKLSERGFAALANGYERGLDFVLRHRFPTLMVFLATVVATVYLFVVIPKGFFPQQDTGILFGTSDAPQDISFAEMAKRQQELGAIVKADPDVENVAMALGAGVGNAAQNNGRMFITLKPREEREADAFQIIARLRPKLAKVKGAHLYLAGGAGRHRRRPLRANAVPVHGSGRQSRRAERHGRRRSWRSLPACRNCATSRPISRSPGRR